MNFLKRWDEDSGPLLVDELAREVTPGHVLFGAKVFVYAQRFDCDEVLFALDDGSERVASVHLTWAGRGDATWPLTTMFSCLTEWLETLWDDRDAYPDGEPPTAYNWRIPKPNATGSWLKYSLEERMKWLDRVRMYFCCQFPAKLDQTVEVVEINGLQIDDYPSFFLVLGEAINGPAGYFGGSTDALADCLCGGFGISVPFTLIWNNHQFSKDKLSASTEPPLLLEPGENLWTVIIDIFASRGIVLKLL
jgi:RNAse (barnase) inhibitor barstar